MILDRMDGRPTLAEGVVCRLGKLFNSTSRKTDCLMNIYVGNLPYKATEDELRQVFSPFGEISSVAMLSLIHI